MTPSGRFCPKPQTWRIVKTSAATCIAVAQASKSPMRDVVTMALAPSRPSAAAASTRRHNSGSGAAIMPARSTPRMVSTLSTVLGSWMPTMESVCKPSWRSWDAIAEMVRSASA